MTRQPGPVNRDLLRHRAAQAAYPDNIANLDVLAEQLTAFETRDNAAAQPFDWRFSRGDLDQLLDSITV